MIVSEKLTAKQEAFAVKFFECGNASEAYRHAYNVGKTTKPETIWSKASELLAIGKVSARVSELQIEARERAMVTVESITAELEEARQLAMLDEKGASAAVAASMGKAKVNGLIVDKKDHSSTDGSMTPKIITRVVVDPKVDAGSE